MQDEPSLFSVDETARRSFEAAWRAGRPEPIEQHLPPPDDPCFLSTLEELVHIDIEMRWKAMSGNDTAGGPGDGESTPLVEAYLRRFPLLEEPPIVLRLLKQEYRTRHRYGDRPAVEDYCARFPKYVATANDVETLLPTPTRPHARQGPEQFPEVAGYEVLALLGRGGMGVVYKARQIALNRLIALKMVRLGAEADAEDLSRFHSEAEASAQLQHPNIVQIYEVGHSDGQPYFSLEFVDGGSLADQLKGAPQAPQTAAQLVETLARAIHYAHSRGIVHRDLKPANVLLSDELQVTGDEKRSFSDSPLARRLSSLIPKIADFGLAKRLQSDSGQTQTGAVLGTPSYMAPEQAAGKKDIGPAADVYALGAILYEMLAGRPPFRGPTAYDTILQVQQSEPVPPTRLQPKVPRDLETICLKCLAKEPSRRYGSAAELADDLGRFQREEPIRARPVSRAERAVKWLKRNPLRAALATALLALVVGAAGIGLWYQQHQVQRFYQAQLLNQNIARALDDGESRRRELHERLADPTKVRPLLGNLRSWQTALNEIKAAWQQAQTLADNEPDALQLDLKERLQTLHQGWQADEKDWQFAFKLDELELESSITAKREPQRASPKYFEAFAQRGWDIRHDNVPSIAERVGKSPIRFALVDALDHWADLESGALMSRLNEIARRVDPNPWRDEIRRYQSNQSLEELLKLATDEDFAAQPPRHLRFLAYRIRNAGGDASAVVRKALLHHPGDFWLNVAAADVAPTPAERIGYYRAALGIRPDDGVTHSWLGYSLIYANVAEGLGHCKKAVQLVPKDARLHVNLGHALITVDDVAGAVKCFQTAVRLDPESAAAYFGLGDALKKLGNENEAKKAFQRYRDLHAKLSKENAGSRDNLESLDALRAGVQGKLNRLLQTDPINFAFRRAYAVRLEAGTSYQVDLTGDFDTLLRIEDGEQVPLVSNDDVSPPGNLDSRLIFTPTESGVYHLVATSYKPGASGSFRLKVTTVSRAEEPIQIEGKLIETKDLFQGKYLMRHLVALRAGCPYVIELESSAFDTYLAVGGAPNIHNAGILPENTRLARIDFTPATSGNFTLFVTSRKTGQTGPYTLIVRGYESVEKAGGQAK